MPLKKLVFKSGVNRENTRYTTEGGYYDCDKIRFRQGTPEKIGGWEPASTDTFLGICRSLWSWLTLSGVDITGIGTNLKFYISRGGYFNDITPDRYSAVTTATLTNPFDTTNSSNVVTVTDAAHGLVTGDVVTFSGCTVTVGGIPATEINARHTITYIGANSYSIEVSSVASSTVSGVGGTISVSRYKYVQVLSNPFDTVSGSPIVTVNDTNHGAETGDFVTFSNATAVGGLTLNGEYQITYVSDNTYTITAAANASATVTGGGGTVYAEYQVNTGPAFEVPLTGWGAGAWGFGSWGNGLPTTDALRLWSQSNFGQDLVFGPRGGGIYYWSPVADATSIGYNVTTMSGASDVPVVQNIVFVSDIYRFVFAFGSNDYSSSEQDPLLIRWSDQESVVDWTPAATNQAGSLRLSHGSQIVAVVQTRQEIFTLTDSAAYSLQYIGPPYVWKGELLGDNISILGQNAIALASGVVFWMGVDKFYKYDGRIQTLRCDLRQYIYNDINLAQGSQVFAGTNEGFNEVWWFYCSANSTEVDKYVIYNYVEDVWYYGTMGRTAWLDSGINDYPVAATYDNTLVNHELGLDDNTNGTPSAINAYIASSQFDIDDGHNLGFIWRIIPDITFRGSSTNNPQVTMSLIPYLNSGSGPNDPVSEGGSDNASVTRTSTVPIEEFTGQVYIRVRGRQLAFKVESNQLGCAWQLGSPRIDIKPDGRR